MSWTLSRNFNIDPKDSEWKLIQHLWSHYAYMDLIQANNAHNNAHSTNISSYSGAHLLQSCSLLRAEVTDASAHGCALARSECGVRSCPVTALKSSQEDCMIWFRGGLCLRNCNLNQWMRGAWWLTTSLQISKQARPVIERKRPVRCAALVLTSFRVCGAGLVITTLQIERKVNERKAFLLFVGEAGNKRNLQMFNELRLESLAHRLETAHYTWIEFTSCSPASRSGSTDRKVCYHHSYDSLWC